MILPYVKAARLCAVSKRALRVSFLGADTTSTPLPADKTVSLVGLCVSSFSYRQWLAPLSSLSFSWRVVSTRPRMLSSTRSPSSPKKNSRRRTALNEPDEELVAPRIARRPWSEPRVRIIRIAAASPLQMLRLESRESALSLSWSPRVQTRRVRQME